MNNERIVEAIGEEALAALRAAGFNVYRPDDCETIELSTAEQQDDIVVLEVIWDGPYEQVMERLPHSEYRLIPVGDNA